MSDGFKTGVSSDDPLGSNDDTEERVDDVPAENEGAKERKTAGETGEDARSATASNETDTSPSSLPWIYARDSITDGRDRTVQLHLQASTVETQTVVRNELENQLDENIRLADLREAALLAGLAHTEDIASMLEEWGYGAE